MKKLLLLYQGSAINTESPFAKSFCAAHKVPLSNSDGKRWRHWYIYIHMRLMQFAVTQDLKKYRVYKKFYLAENVKEDPKVVRGQKNIQ